MVNNKILNIAGKYYDLPKNTVDSVYNSLKHKIRNDLGFFYCEIIYSLKKIDDPKYILLDGSVYNKYKSEKEYIMFLYLGDRFRSHANREILSTDEFAVPNLQGRYLSCRDDLNVLNTGYDNSDFNIQSFTLVSKDNFAQFTPDTIENLYFRSRKVKGVEEKYENYDKDTSSRIISSINGTNVSNENRGDKGVYIDDKTYYYYLKVIEKETNLVSVKKEIPTIDLGEGFVFYEEKLYQDNILYSGLYENKLYFNGLLTTGYQVYNEKLYYEGSLHTRWDSVFNNLYYSSNGSLLTGFTWKNVYHDKGIALYQKPLNAKYDRNGSYHECFGGDVNGAIPYGSLLGFKSINGYLWGYYHGRGYIRYNRSKTEDNITQWICGNLFGGDNNDSYYEKVYVVNGVIYYRCSNNNGYIVRDGSFMSSWWKYPNGGYTNNYLTSNGSNAGYHPYHLHSALEIYYGRIRNKTTREYYTGCEIFKHYSWS